jgi:hypothetical protein
MSWRDSLVADAVAPATPAWQRAGENMYLVTALVIVISFIMLLALRPAIAMQGGGTGAVSWPRVMLWSTGTGCICLMLSTWLSPAPVHAPFVDGPASHPVRVSAGAADSNSA